MSKLSNLTGKPKTFTIGGEEINLKPRTLKDLDLLMELTNEDKKAEALKKLISLSLKEAIPDATDEEVDAVGLQYFKELSEAIVEVNGLNDTSS